MELKWLERIDRRIAYIIAIIVVCFVLLSPLGLPLVISDRARNYYDVVDAVPEGARALITCTLGIGNYRNPEAFPTYVATVNHLAQNNVKLIFVGLQSLDDWALIELCIKNGDFDLTGKIYGVDYVIVGYVGGLEAGTAAWAKDVIGTKPLDYRGDSLIDMEIMAGIETAADFDFWHIASPTTSNTEAFMRQIEAPFGLKPTITTPSTQAGPSLIYVVSGQALEILWGAKMGAEYESLLGMPGTGAATVDALSLLVVITISFIFISNIPLLAEKLGRKPKPIESSEKGGI